MPAETRDRQEVEIADKTIPGRGRDPCFRGTQEAGIHLYQTMLALQPRLVCRFMILNSQKLMNNQSEG